MKKSFFRRHTYKLLISAFILCVGIAAAKIVRQEREAFAMSKDLPRGAIVYAQFSDLPGLIKRWDESKLKSKYVESENFERFQNRHLTLKLLKRWEEFNDALGFSLDANALIGSSENKTAIALYDIGGLDIVFIAPISSDKIAETIFHKNKDKFEERSLADDTTYYSLSFEADRGRKQQKVLFTAVKGRFVLATNESLFLRTVANINGKTKKDSLADEPSFFELSKIVTPHDATVWVDQKKLNKDLYFKHYWLMSNASDLKNIRAGMFDLEIKEDKWIERREFLSVKNESYKTISQSEINKMKEILPKDAPLLKMKTVDNEHEAELLIRKTLFDTLKDNKNQTERKSWDSFTDFDYARSDYRYHYDYLDYYSSIDSRFDEKIDDLEETENEIELKKEFLQEVIQKAEPVYSVFVAKPQPMKEPFFAEFNRSLFLKLRKPNAFSSKEFEDSISTIVENKLLVSGAKANLKWADGKENDLNWRELSLPMLGWKLCYRFENTELIIANNTNTMMEILALQRNRMEPKAKDKSFFQSVTVIRFDKRDSTYNQIVQPLEKNTDSFFLNDIGSLLDVIADVKTVEIKKKATLKGFHEEVEISLEKK